MHIAAANPKWVRREDVSPEAIANEKNIYQAQMEGSGKPAHVLDRIIDGKLGSFYSQFVLLDQPSIRDPNVTVAQLVARDVGQDGGEHHHLPVSPATGSAKEATSSMSLRHDCRAAPLSRPADRAARLVVIRTQSVRTLH